jgi:hypothetical protein
MVTTWVAMQPDETLQVGWQILCGPFSTDNTNTLVVMVTTWVAMQPHGKLQEGWQIF